MRMYPSTPPSPLCSRCALDDSGRRAYRACAAPVRPCLRKHNLRTLAHSCPAAPGWPGHRLLASTTSPAASDTLASTPCQQPCMLVTKPCAVQMCPPEPRFKTEGADAGMRKHSCVRKVCSVMDPVSATCCADEPGAGPQGRGGQRGDAHPPHCAQGAQLHVLLQRGRPADAAHPGVHHQARTRLLGWLLAS